MKILILTIMMVALSSCESMQQDRANNGPCKPLGGGIWRCDYPNMYCIKSYSFIPYQGLTANGTQCFEKKS